MSRLFQSSLIFLCGIVALGSLTYTDNVTYMGTAAGVKYYTITTVATTTTTTVPPLGNYIEWLVDEAGGTNALGLVDDTSGNGYDGTITGGMTWTPGTNGQSGYFYSLNDTTDYVLGTNDGTLKDYALVKMNNQGGTELSWPWNLGIGHVPSGVAGGPYWVTTNATTIEAGDGSLANDVNIGPFYATTNNLTDADINAIWWSAMTNYGLPVWFAQNKALYSNMTLVVDFAGNCGSMADTTNSENGAVVNMSISEGHGVFNGSSAKITMGAEARHDVTETNTWTATAWIYMNTAVSEDSIVSKQQQGGNYPGWRGTIADSTNLQFIVSHDNSPAQYYHVKTPKASLSLSTWHHVAFTHTGGLSVTNARVQIDGIQQSLTVLTDGLIAGIVNNEGFRIGGWNSIGYFDGSIDAVTFSTPALSSNQVLNLKQASNHLVNVIGPQ